jgi:hypothetical protein
LESHVQMKINCVSEPVGKFAETVTRLICIRGMMGSILEENSENFVVYGRSSRKML